MLITDPVELAEDRVVVDIVAVVSTARLPSGDGGATQPLRERLVEELGAECHAGHYSVSVIAQRGGHVPSA